jgi:hypothetical protein
LATSGPEDSGQIIATLALVGGKHSFVAKALLDCTTVKPTALVDALVAVAAAGCEEEHLSLLAKRLGDSAAELTASTVVKLATACAKNRVLRTAMSGLATATISDLQSWTTDDVMKLLLAAAKVRDDMTPASNQALLTAALEWLRPRMHSMSGKNIVKLVLAVSGSGHDELLELLGGVVANRMLEIPHTQLALVMQGLSQGLPANHDTFHSAVKAWPALFEANVGIGNNRLSPDDVAKVAQTLGPTLTVGDRLDHVRFAKAAGDLLLKRSQDLSPLGRELVVGLLQAGGALAPFTKGAALLQAVGARARSRSPRPKCKRS